MMSRPKAAPRRLIVALGLLACLGVAAIAHAAPPTATTRADAFTATVAYAVDGDTLRIEEADGDLAYVRLIGIDSPESVKPDTTPECGGEGASESMDHLAPEGATVRLVFDGEREDDFGRTLAHAYVGGRQLELAQLRQGWAEIYRYHGRTFAGLTRYYALQARAKAAGRGVWGQCGGDFHSGRD
jgi:micrococcal nuclease